MKEKYIIIDNQKIFYRENIVNPEDKNILFFMHGWGASSDLFLKIFPKEKNWIALDFPNFGKSSKVSQAWTMENYAKNTHKFIQKVMKNKNIFYITHSFGGRVLLKMISLFSLETEKIIYMGVPFYRNNTAKISKKSLIIKYFHKIFNLPVLSLAKKPLQKILYKLIYSEDYLALQNDKIMQKTFKSVVSDDLAPYISLVENKENILIWGEDDEIVPLKKAEKFLEETKNSKLHKIKNSGHFPFLENTSEFLEIFNKLIK